jgi:hypothetical protein
MTTHHRNTNIYSSNGIRTHDPSNDLRLRPPGYRDQRTPEYRSCLPWESLKNVVCQWWRNLIGLTDSSCLALDWLLGRSRVTCLCQCRGLNLQPPLVRTDVLSVDWHSRAEHYSRDGHHMVDVVTVTLTPWDRVKQCLHSACAFEFRCVLERRHWEVKRHFWI